jgi:hypothetical protein
MRDRYPDWRISVVLILAVSVALFMALPSWLATPISVGAGSSGWSWGRRWLP